MVARKANYKGNTEKWGNDPNKHVTYEFDFQGTTVKAGMQVKLKGDYSTYTFICLVHDSRLDKTWMDLLGPCGFAFKTLDRFNSIVGVKRSYKKKLTS